MAKDLKFVVSADIDKLQKALDRGQRSSTSYARRTSSDLDKAGNSTRRHARLVDASMQRTDRAFRAVGRAAAGVGLIVGGAALVGFHKMTEEQRESQRVGRSTIAVLDSTGGQANVTAGEVDKLATAVSNKTAIDDEEIQTSANLLLTFTKVHDEMGRGNDVFSRAIPLIADMSAMTGSLHGNTKLVGKALNDPLKGISALSRAGVSFTQGQKDQIKTWVESGDTLKAQKLILRELATEFEGQAAAKADPLQRFTTSANNLAEKLGEYVLPALGDVAGAANDFMAQIEDGVGIGGRFADGFKTAFDTIGDIISGGVDAFNGDDTTLGGLLPDPRSFVDKLIDGIGGALGAIDWAGVMDFGESIKVGVEQGIADALENIDTAVLANLMLETTLDALTMAMDPVWIANHIVEIIGIALAFSKIGVLRKIPIIGEAFGKVGDYIIKGAKWGIQKAIPGLGHAIWDGVETAFESFYRQSPKLATKFGTVLGDVVNFFPKLAGKIRGSGGRILTAIGDGIKSRVSWLAANALTAIGRVVSVMIDKASTAGRAGRQIVSSVWGGITRLSGRLASAGRWVVGRIGDGISAAVSGLANIGKRIGNTIINAAKSALGIHSPSTVFREIGQHMVSGLAQGINPGNVRALIGNVFGGMGKFVGGMVSGGLVSLTDLPGNLMKYVFGGGNGPGSIVSLGKMLQQMGYSVSENPAFGGVQGKHAPGSYHYKGRALDINADGAPGGEAAALDRLYGMLKVLPGVAELLWRVPDHFDHLHVAMRRGGKAGPMMGGPDVVYGEGLKDEWWISQEGSKIQNTLWGIEALEAVSGKQVALFKGGGKVSAKTKKKTAKKVKTFNATVDKQDAYDAAYEDPKYNVNLTKRLAAIDKLLKAKGLTAEARNALLNLRGQVVDALKPAVDAAADGSGDSSGETTPAVDPQIFIDLAEQMAALTAKIGLVHDTGAYELAQALIDIRNGNMAGSAADAFRLQPAGPRYT